MNAALRIFSPLEPNTSRKNIEEIFWWVCGFGGRTPPEWSGSLISIDQIRIVRTLISDKWKSEQERREIFFYIANLPLDEIMGILQCPREFFITHLLRCFMRSRQQEFLYMRIFSGIRSHVNIVHDFREDAIRYYLSKTPGSMPWEKKVGIQ